MNFSRKTQKPLISISDPLVDKYQNLSLAWYIGDSYIRNIDDIILEIISKIHKNTQKRILLTGVSGGGFAVLNLIKKATLKKFTFLDFLVINPSTNLDYSLGLQKYLEICNIKDFNTKEYSTQIKDISTDINGIYLQNINDKYFLNHHFNHFFSEKNETSINFIKYIGKNGHKPLLAEEYYYLLENFYNKSKISVKKDYLQSYLYHFDVFFSEIKNNLIIDIKNNSISITSKNLNNYNLKYAIYINTKEKLHKFGYKNSIDIRQDSINIDEINNIRLFIMDSNSNKKSIYLNWKEIIKGQD